jgi:hypothetical protein
MAVFELERTPTMQEGTWEEYGTPGTTLLDHDDIERAIRQLERLWDETAPQAQPFMNVSSDLGGCDCRA